jgi:hypothetical protein
VGRSDELSGAAVKEMQPETCNKIAVLTSGVRERARVSDQQHHDLDANGATGTFSDGRILRMPRHDACTRLPTDPASLDPMKERGLRSL